jgi:hypothetical protein
MPFVQTAQGLLLRPPLSPMTERPTSRHAKASRGVPAMTEGFSWGRRGRIRIHISLFSACIPIIPTQCSTYHCPLSACLAACKGNRVAELCGLPGDRSSLGKPPPCWI